MENKIQDEWLSPHFRLSELTRSGVALSLGIRNEAPAEARERLRALCVNVLEPLRGRFGAIRVTSGYRCERLNKAVGGVAGSQHLLGEAADLHIADMDVGRRMYDFLRRETDFDQLLLERRLRNGCAWLHVSYTTRRANRRMASPLTVK